VEQYGWWVILAEPAHGQIEALIILQPPSAAERLNG